MNPVMGGTSSHAGSFSRPSITGGVTTARAVAGGGGGGGGALWLARSRGSWTTISSASAKPVFIVSMPHEGRDADGFFQWNQPQARSLIVKYTRQFGRGG